MYINKVHIKQIRSIDEFIMEFPAQPGWHVLIGDNGAGKSSVVRAIALALIGPSNAQALRLPFVTWIRNGQNESSISVTLLRDQTFDGYAGQKKPLKRPFEASIIIKRQIVSGFEIGFLEKGDMTGIDPDEFVWSGKSGWFSTAFGPFRRFTGGDKDWSKVYYSNPKAAAHLSVFGEDIALTESLEWLSLIKFQSFEANDTSIGILQGLKKFINNGDLLPHGAVLKEVTSQGVYFVDGNENEIDVTQMSDGFRSLLSLIFELIRQLVNTYGEEVIFKNILNDEMIIDVPGVVLIDEIDAHLHPTWQTRIGQWFTRFFPKMQFIVTTHSPLVCRACENGSIWRLASPGSEHRSGLVSDVDRNRLIYGNILDAYGTEVFGEEVSQGEKGTALLKELADLNREDFKGKLTAEGKKRIEEIKQIVPTAS